MTLRSLIPIDTSCVFADDFVIFSEIWNGTDQSLLNDHPQYQASCDWCSEWEMSFNFCKCVSMQFTGQCALLAFQRSLSYRCFENVPTFKHPGIHSYLGMLWHNRKDNICKKPMSKFLHRRRALKRAPTPTKLISYKMLTRPALLDVVWVPRSAFSIFKL